MSQTLGLKIKKLTRPTTGRPTTARPHSEREKVEEDLFASESNLKEIREESMLMMNANNELGEGMGITNGDNGNVETHSLIDQRSELEKIMNEENERIEFLESQKQKLKQIDLIEKDTEGLYDWKTLFTKSRPITAYTRTDLKFSYYNNQEEEKNSQSRLGTIMNNENKSSNAITNNDIFGEDLHRDSTNNQGSKVKLKEKPFKFPVALIDEKEEAINDYITIHKNISAKRKKMEDAMKLIPNSKFFQEKSASDTVKDPQRSTLSQSKESNIIINKSQRMNHTARGLRSNAARPQSLFAKRGDDDIFYLDKKFSDYIVQEESEFAKKFPLLHPKVRCNSKSLRRTLKVVKNSNQLQIEVKKKTKDLEEDLRIENKELNLAGNSKNPIPLLRSIFRQINPDLSEEPIQSNKLYLNSNKPLGNSTDKIDFKKNLRNENMLSHYSSRGRFNSNSDSPGNKELILEMYNSNDPEVQIFKEAEAKFNSSHAIEEIEDINVNPAIETNSKELNDLFENIIVTTDKKDQAVETINSGNISANGNKIKKYSRPQTANLFNNKLLSNPNKMKNLTARQSISRERSPTNEKKHPATAKRVELKTAKSQCYVAPINTRGLPYKEKSSAHPHAYQVMKNNLNYYSFKNENKLFDDVVMVENINDEIKEEISGGGKIDSGDSFDDERKEKLNNRPFTSSNFKQRPISKMVDRISKGESKFGKNYLYNYILIALGTLTIDSFRPGNKSLNKNGKKVNNIYFNDYIDMQFRVMNSTSRMNFNLGRGSDSQFVMRKNNNNPKNTMDSDKLSDLMVISSLNFNSNINKSTGTSAKGGRTAKSARVKV